MITIDFDLFPHVLVAQELDQQQRRLVLHIQSLRLVGDLHRSLKKIQSKDWSPEARRDQTLLEIHEIIYLQKATDVCGRIKQERSQRQQKVENARNSAVT